MAIYQNVAIVGVGLIGGSIGLALRNRGLAEQVVGIGRRQASLDKAIACGAIDRGVLQLEAGVQAAEIVIVATPVAMVVEDVCRGMAASPPETWITDVGSTKANICRGVESQLEQAASRFVGSHPLAGDHRTGPENAREDLFVGKTVVITPTQPTSPATIEQAEKFWEAVGAKVVPMPPELHDQALAATSHLPHVVASALAAATPEEWLPLAATGWADTTRVAAGDPELWAQIFAQNIPPTLAALDSFISQLQQARAALAAEDWSQVQVFLQQAKRIRDALGN